VKLVFWPLFNAVFVRFLAEIVGLDKTLLDYPALPESATSLVVTSVYKMGKWRGTRKERWTASLIDRGKLLMKERTVSGEK